MQFNFTEMVQAMQVAHPGRLDLNARLVLRDFIAPGFIFVAMPYDLHTSAHIYIRLPIVPGEIWVGAHPESWAAAERAFLELVQKDWEVLEPWRQRGYGDSLTDDLMVGYIHLYFWQSARRASERPPL